MKDEAMGSKGVLCLLVMLALAATAWGQLTIDGVSPVYDSVNKTYLLTVPESAFGKPYHGVAVLDPGVTSMTIDGKQVTASVDFPLVEGDASYPFVFTRGGVVTRSTIHFTFLPILLLNGTFSDDYAVGSITLIMPGEPGRQDYSARVKWAGSSTDGTWTHKRNYHLKFIDEEGDKTDVSFFGLRSDNHWRLDAGTVDMIRFRNKTAHELWADFAARPYYAAVQPNARNYVRGNHVELFLNGGYRGFYNMMEYLDRKQMKLKKFAETDDDDDDDESMSVTFHGMMWKAKLRTAQTLMMSVGNDAVDNTQDCWGGFELEYPGLDDVCPTDYSVIRNAIQFVSRSTTLEFAQQAGEYFDLPVLLKYYVFIHTLFAIDNTDKNIIWACYDSEVDKKLTIAVWDLDATAGQHYIDNDGYYHADAIQPENEFDNAPASISGISQSALFRKLKTLPDFRYKVTNCYWRLRRTVLDPDSLVARYATVYQRLLKSGTLNREAARWSDTGDIAHRMLTFDAEFDYMCDWLRRRIAYLDTHTFACQRGDLNGDGNVDIIDVTILISYVLNSSTPVEEMLNADLSVDDQVDIADIALLIDKVLSNK